MSDPLPKVSLNQQIEEVNASMSTIRRIGDQQVRRGELRQTELDYRLRRLEATWRTLGWLRDNEAQIRAFLRLPADVRAAVIASAQPANFTPHGGTT